MTVNSTNYGWIVWCSDCGFKRTGGRVDDPLWVRVSLDKTERGREYVHSEMAKHLAGFHRYSRGVINVNLVTKE